MRTFTRTKLEYFEFQLEGDETVYRIPLAANMPIGLIERMGMASKEDALGLQIDILRKYMGDAANELPLGMVKDIFMAWTEESTKAGANVGES